MSDGLRVSGSNNIVADNTSVKKAQVKPQDMTNMNFSDANSELNLKSTNNTSKLSSGNAQAIFPIFEQTPTNTGITKDTLITAIKNSDLSDKYEGNSKSKETMDRIAEASISVGQKENVDPRLLFAIAMQESDCGTNTKHAGSAKGAMGILPGALKAVKSQPEFKKGLESTTHAQLATNHEKSMVVAARYLKVAARELEAKVNKGISEDSLGVGNLNSDTWKILSSYRWGAGAAAKDLKKDGDIDKGYEKTFKDYLSSMGVNLFKK
ncbi:MAG: transglycosylase SLT domain-containing protein [Candidatus Sericytochromatia bacterium]